MTKLLINNHTAEELTGMVSQAPHAILLYGPNGSGKFSVACWLAEQLLQIRENSLGTYPYYLHLTPRNEVIGVDDSRQLISFLNLKTTGQNKIRRVVIIENAHLMTTEAQNTLLKTLEDPPKDTIVIVTALRPQSLLPTISSRLRPVAIKKPTLEQTEAFLGTLFDKQNYKLANGQIGLLLSLSKDEGQPITQQVQQAKQLLANDDFNRLTQIDSLVKQRTELLGIINALTRIASAGIAQTIKKNQAAAKRWHTILIHSNAAYLQLLANANPKLVLTNLLLNV